MSASMRIAVLDDYQDVALQMADWSEVDGAVDTFADHVVDPAKLVERLRPYDVVVLMRERTPFPAEVIEALPGLRLIVSTGRRNKAVDVEAARRCGITVSATESPSQAPTELTWALILGLARHLVAEDRHLRGGGWQTTLGTDLAGRTLGVVGLGRIGTRVAAVGRAFEMRVLAHSRTLTSERAEQAGASAMPMDTLLAEADVVTVHVPLNDETRGLIGERELAAMKAHALLVNTSRAGIVDTDALVSALEGGRIGGAGLDVYDEEPLPADHPLRRAPRTLLTPHIGYVTENVYRVFFTGVVEDIVAFAAGAPIRTLP
ncbi:MAG TPA: D-2-hydroxyacid dehydrogenase family protein [Nocardioidaceae bacterium]|nr:D-2-hydroxyacid dehydrogenase family protein [Nocardioidaceae bacterium]